MPTGNTYCDTLGIELPCLEDLAPAREPSLLQWMVLALVENGAPMPLDAIAARLDELCVHCNTGDMPHSLRKAWHGLKPVFQTPDGQFGLDAHDWQVRHVLRTVGLLADRSRPPAPEVRRPDVSEPITVEEIEALCAEGISTPSTMRVAAAVVEAVGRAIQIEEVEHWVQCRLKFGEFRLNRMTARAWRAPILSIDGDGWMVLDGTPAELAAMRQNIRAVVHPRLVRKARDAAITTRMAEVRDERKVEAQRLTATAAQRRHALVHLVPDTRAPEATVILDVEARTFTFAAGNVASGSLDAFDVIIGLDVRHSLHSLGIAADRPRGERDAWRLVDLSPPQKTLRLNKQGRKLEITTDLLLRGTTGLTLGDPGRIAGYLQTSDHRRLFARLQADAKALYAYYFYGRLHGYVRLRWGFIDDILGVEWALPGDIGLFGLLEQAVAEGGDVDVVIGNAPGWEDPWSRARSGSVHREGMYRVELDGRDVPLAEVQAVRLVSKRDSTQRQGEETDATWK